MRRGEFCHFNLVLHDYTKTTLLLSQLTTARIYATKTLVNYKNLLGLSTILQKVSRVKL